MPGLHLLGRRLRIVPTHVGAAAELHDANLPRRQLIRHPLFAGQFVGIGGLFGANWERREINKYLRRRRAE